MADTNYFEYPPDRDNEVLIIVNLMRDEENRLYFSRQGKYKHFRYKEFQTISWAINEAVNEKLEINIDMILLKSKSCPIKYTVEATFLKTILESPEYPTTTIDNFKVHLEKLSLDFVKSQISEKMFSSLHTIVSSPTSSLVQIEERIDYLKGILKDGYSANSLEFKGMEQIIPEYINERENRKEKYSTGFDSLDEYLTEGFAPKQITTVAALASMGKCLRKSTKILMYDCSFKNVEDIIVGDLLMGPDSKPRKVLSTTKGFGDMYKIHQKRGDDYFVNEHHILSLKKMKQQYHGRNYLEKTINISVKDYLELSNNQKSMLRGYKTFLDFEEKEILLDPYILGLWLADGRSNIFGFSVNNNDIEIINELYSFAKKNNSHINIRNIQNNSKDFFIVPNEQKRFNLILDILRKYNVWKNKHIPKEFLINSKENRLSILAGILDGDASLVHMGNNNFRFELQMANEALIKDVQFLCRSLGFSAHLHKYNTKRNETSLIAWMLYINGNIWDIPTKLSRKKAQFFDKRRANKLLSKIEISYDGQYDYYGFELDGDGLFILEDFTVTHNSSFVLSSMKNLANMGVFTAQFALEMNNISLVHKLLAFNTRLPLSTILGPFDNLTDDEKKLYTWELSRLKENKYIYLDDKPTQKLSNIREQIMLLQDHLKTEYMVVVIDLFGKISEFQSSDNFARDYEKHANTVQRMTKELGIHTVLVAQIRKDVAQRRFSRPTMNDLKNTGALTEISDTMMGVHRPYYNPELALKTKISESIIAQGDLFNSPTDTNINNAMEDMDKNVAEIIIMKQRMGENNVLINFFFDPQTTCFFPCTAGDSKRLNENKADLLGE